MPKYTATSRIDYAPLEGSRHKAQVFNPGDSVPEEIAKTLPEGIVFSDENADMPREPFDPARLPIDHPKRQLLESIPKGQDQTRLNQADLAQAVIDLTASREAPQQPNPHPTEGMPEAPGNLAEVPKVENGNIVPPDQVKTAVSKAASGPKPPQTAARPASVSSKGDGTVTTSGAKGE